jgi:hypothetical protein
MSIRSPLLFVRVSLLTVCAIESEPLASIGNAYFQQGTTLQIVQVCLVVFTLEAPIGDCPMLSWGEAFN